MMAVPLPVSLIQGNFSLATATGEPGEPGTLMLDHHRRIFTDPQFFGSVVNSLVFTLGAATLAIGSGGLVVRTATRFRLLTYLDALVVLRGAGPGSNSPVDVPC
jgi:ABC-type Fe3+ transport system permease subunit